MVLVTRPVYRRDKKMSTGIGRATGILRRRIGIENQVDEFLDLVSESGLIFKLAIGAYLRGDIDAFLKKIEQITTAEHKGDSLTRTLEERLYVQTLIPDSRGDVLELLENMDSLLDNFKGALWQFEIERPEIWPEFHDAFNELVGYVVEAVEAVVLSSRAFFKNIAGVSDHMHKVSYWETESDKVASDLQRAIFKREEMRMSHRLQLRDFAKRVDNIADVSEDVADRLAIYVIKRSL
jgi:predicted phosphate transport protein (TIGR00153 family)